MMSKKEYKHPEAEIICLTSADEIAGAAGGTTDISGPQSEEPIGS